MCTGGGTGAHGPLCINAGAGCSTAGSKGDGPDTCLGCSTELHDLGESGRFCVGPFPGHPSPSATRHFLAANPVAVAAAIGVKLITASWPLQPSPIPAHFRPEKTASLPLCC